MIRILHVVRLMNRGGIETFLMNLYHNVNREEVQFDFLIQSDEKGVFDDEIVALGGRLHHIPYLTDNGYSKYTKALYLFFINHNEYKIIHSHMNSMSGLILRIAQKAEIPVRIAHSHVGKLEGNLLQKLMRKFLQHNIGIYATDLFACSRLAAKCIFEKYAEKAIIINNGIEVNMFIFNESVRNKIRKEWNIGDYSLVIGNIGRMGAEKNQRFLIDIFKQIHDIIEDSVLIIVGTGELLETLIMKVVKLGLQDAVRFLGVCENVNEILQGFDAFVLPSLYEGLGITLVEAQAAGLKTFTSKNTVPMEAKVTDLLKYIPLEKPCQYWAEAIISSMGYTRKNMYRELVDKHYDIKDCTKQLEEFYLERSFSKE